MMRYSQSIHGDIQCAAHHKVINIPIIEHGHLILSVSLMLQWRRFKMQPLYL
jgi:hypothetical protein